MCGCDLRQECQECVHMILRILGVYGMCESGVSECVGGVCVSCLKVGIVFRCVCVKDTPLVKCFEGSLVCVVILLD